MILSNISTDHPMKEQESLQPLVLLISISCDRYLYNIISKFKIYHMKLFKGLYQTWRRCYYTKGHHYAVGIKSKDRFMWPMNLFHIGTFKTEFVIVFNRS